MRLKVISTALLLSICLMACGENNVDEKVTSNEVVQEESMDQEEPIVEESTVTVPFDCQVTISDETGVDYSCIIATMDSIEQLNSYITAVLSLTTEYPNSVYSFDLKDSNENIMLSIDDGNISVVSTDSDDKKFFDYPSWYKETSDNESVEVLKYILSQAEKGQWKTIE